MIDNTIFCLFPKIDFEWLKNIKIIPYFLGAWRQPINYLWLNHRRMGHGFRFLLPPFLYYPPFFQNFHINHSFFKIFIIIRFFFIWQYQSKNCGHRKHVFSREANVSFRNSSHKAKNIYTRADNNNPPGVAHNRNRYWWFAYHDDYRINLIWEININKYIPKKRELSWLNI